MNDLIHADIFFFVTTVLVVLAIIFLAIAAVYIIRILSDFKSLTGRIKREGQLLSDDLAELRSKTRQEGLRWSHLADFFSKRRRSTRARK